MPRIKKMEASGRAVRICGAPGCGKRIQKGEEYFTWSFRTVGRQVRCVQHPPKQSELTLSKLSQVYEAVENFQTTFKNGADSFESIEEAVREVAVEVRQVAEEYREAAEKFGGQGANAERADALEEFGDELENFDTSEWTSEDEFDEEQVGAEISQDEWGIDNPNDLDEDQRLEWHDMLQACRDDWDNQHENLENSKIQEALDQAIELMNTLTL